MNTSHDITLWLATFAGFAAGYLVCIVRIHLGRWAWRVACVAAILSCLHFGGKVGPYACWIRGSLSFVRESLAGVVSDIREVTAEIRQGGG